MFLLKRYFHKAPGSFSYFSEEYHDGVSSLQSSENAYFEVNHSSLSSGEGQNIRMANKGLCMEPLPLDLENEESFIDLD